MAGLWVMPQLDAERSDGAFTARVAATADPARPLGLVEYRETFLWHLRRPSYNFGHRRFREGEQELYDAAAWLAQDPDRQLLVPEPGRARCFADADARSVGETGRRTWWIVSGRPDSGCASRGDGRRAILYVPSTPE
jgi:hypothetical protein